MHTQTTHRVRSASPSAAPSNSTPTMQAVVASELKQGEGILVLFWNPHSSDDIAVAGQVKAVAHTLGRHVAVHTAYASQVNSFGSMTRGIQVYQTPTLMIVNPHGQVTTLTGYTDAYAIEQAIAEAGDECSAARPRRRAVVVSSPAPPGSRGQLACTAG